MLLMLSDTVPPPHEEKQQQTQPANEQGTDLSVHKTLIRVLPVAGEAEGSSDMKEKEQK